MRDWKATLNVFLTPTSWKFADYAVANADMIQRAVRGIGPDATKPTSEAGARMVANMSAAHIPAFCASGYKNAYDLGKLRLGANPRTYPRRALVDSCLPIDDPPVSGHFTQIYFGAVELNGAGIRFYGDICLVLKSDHVPAKTVVLDRNSYDLIRVPLANSTCPGGTPDSVALQDAAKDHAGTWSADLERIATIKVLEGRTEAERRLTTAAVSTGILEDEDYIEVLRIGSFQAQGLEEARVFASDAATEAQIADRLRVGSAPALAELQWRHRRRVAERELSKAGVRQRVITTLGRARS